MPIFTIPLIVLHVCEWGGLCFLKECPSQLCICRLEVKVIEKLTSCANHSLFYLFTCNYVFLYVKCRFVYLNYLKTTYHSCAYPPATLQYLYTYNMHMHQKSYSVCLFLTCAFSFMQSLDGFHGMLHMHLPSC